MKLAHLGRNPTNVVTVISSTHHNNSFCGQRKANPFDFVPQIKEGTTWRAVDKPVMRDFCQSLKDRPKQRVRQNHRLEEENKFEVIQKVRLSRGTENNVYFCIFSIRRDQVD